MPIKSINGEKILVGTSEIEDNSITDAKLTQSGGVLSKVNGLIGEAAFSTYSRSIGNTRQITDVTSSVAIESGKIIGTDGSISANSAYNIGTYTAEAGKKYAVGLLSGTLYDTMRTIELIDSDNNVVAYVIPKKNALNWFVVERFDGTIRVCYRAVNSSSMKLRICVDKDMESIDSSLSVVEAGMSINEVAYSFPSEPNGYINNSGVLVSSDGFYTTELFEAQGSLFIMGVLHGTGSAFRIVSAYGVDGEYIGGVLSGDLNYAVPTAVNLPANTYYVRITKSTQEGTDFRIFCNYQGIPIEGVLPISKEDTDFIHGGNNLYDENDVHYGKYLNWNNGTLGNNSNYLVSNYFQLTQDTYYTMNAPLQTCIYDSDKQFIGGFYLVPNGTFYYSESLGNPDGWVSYTSAGNPITFKAQTGWAYARSTFSKSILVMINAGRKLLVYEPPMLLIDDLNIPSENINRIGSAFPYGVLADIIESSGTTIKLIGDSITAGVGGTGYDATASGGGELIYGTAYENVAGHCWANLLKEYWESKFDCTVKNFGVSGIHSATIISKWSDLVRSGDDIVMCTIGTNDRAACDDVSEFIANLMRIVDLSIMSEKKLVLVANVPASVSNETNGTKHFHMEDVAHAVRYVSAARDVPFVDMYDALMDYCEYEGVTIDSLLNDGLHPNDGGYDVMFALMTKAFGIAPKRPDATW